MNRICIYPIMFALILSGCSFQKLALRTTTGIFSYSVEALYDEVDLQLAEQAMASNLKLLEGFHKADPTNKEILLLLTQGFASYSMGFVEDDNVARAKLFYLRARDYGFLLLKQTKAFRDSIPTQEKNFLERIQRTQQSDIAAIYWTAFAWGGWIGLSKDDPQAIFDLGKVKAMMTRVIELDESFFYGTAHLFFGTIAGSLPRMLGGDPEQARLYFEKCLALNNERLMLGYVYLARYYAQPLLDEALFDKYLKIVLQAPIDILPENRLLTAIAKDKAQKLIIKKQDLF
jgi:tetratricopeptide (TPR) repeat protein